MPKNSQPDHTQARKKNSNAQASVDQENQAQSPNAKKQSNQQNQS